MDYPTVLVRWHDATSDRNILFDRVDELEPVPVETVGFLVKYTADVLVLLNGMVAEHHAQDSVLIPTSTVDEVIPFGPATWRGRDTILPDEA